MKYIPIEQSLLEQVIQSLGDLELKMQLEERLKEAQHDQVLGIRVD